MTNSTHPVIERVQTGIRIEKRLLKVLKGMAEYADITLGDLVEGIVLHSLEGKSPFDEKAQDGIRKLKAVYGLDLTAADSHKLVEAGKRRDARAETGKPDG